MTWHDDNSNLDRVAASVLKLKKQIKAECCSKAEIHIHADVEHVSRFRRGTCSAWIWCSNCGSFSHLDGLPISSDWTSNSGIDFDRITAVPVYLESEKESIDKHLIDFLK